MRCISDRAVKLKQQSRCHARGSLPQPRLSSDKEDKGEEDSKAEQNESEVILEHDSQGIRKKTR
jgi:hypothetical protein